MVLHQLLWIYTVLVPSFTMFTQPAGMMDGELAPILDTESVTVTEQAGNDVELSCYVRNIGENTVTWTDGNYNILTSDTDLLVNDQRLSIRTPYEGEFILSIADVRPTDAGTYNCMVQIFPPQFKAVQLVVTARPSIDSRSLSDAVVTEGQRLVRDCQATGVPAPEVRWYKVRRYPDTFQDTRELYVSGETLEIRNIRRSDGGRYLCRAENEHGVDELEMYVNVLYPPKVAAAIPEITVTSGESAVLECSVDMKPVEDIHWLRNDNKIHNSWKYGLAMYNDTNTTKMFLTLTIRQTEVADTGVYMCTARNMVGGDQLYAQIHVLKPTTTEAPTVPPLIDTSRLKLNYVFTEGTSVNITCHVTGTPSPRVTWFKYVGDILAKFTEGEQLEIQSIQKDDTGRYVCQAVNEHSTVSHTANIDVHYPPSVTTPETNLTVTEGSTITLQCSADSNPRSQIVWKFNSLTLSNSWKVKEQLYTDSEDSTESSLHLTIKPVDLGNAGQYICVAKNHLGENSVTIDVTVFETTTEESPTTTMIEPVNLVTATEPKQTSGPKTGASAINSASGQIYTDITNILATVFIFITAHCLL